MKESDVEVGEVWIEIDLIRNDDSDLNIMFFLREREKDFNVLD